MLPDEGGDEDKAAVNVLDHHGVDGVSGEVWQAGSVTLLVQTSARYSPHGTHRCREGLQGATRGDNFQIML